MKKRFTLWDGEGSCFDWFDKAKNADKLVMVMTLYHMWLARNVTRDGEVIETPGC